MKINILGHGHAYYLAMMLTDKGILTDNNSPNYDYYDVNLVMGLKEIPKNPPENLAVFVMGSDYWNNKGKVRIPDQTRLILYPHQGMLSHGDLNGQICEKWRVPVNEDMFGIAALFLRRHTKPSRDTLLYAADMIDHCLDSRIMPYIGQFPNKKITLLSSAYNNITNAEINNLLLIPRVPYPLMPHMYARHREFRQWINHPGAGHPGIMCYEALICGCKSYFNDEEVKEIPADQLSQHAIPELLRILEEYF